MIVAQVQQMKMFNAQLEKEMRAEGRKNRKLVEKVFMPIQMIFEIEIQVEGKVTHLRSFVEGWKASEKQVEEVERQVEDNLEGIRKATSAQMRVILFCCLTTSIKYR